MKKPASSQSANKITVKPPKPGKPIYVFTDSSWLINLEEIACAELRGKQDKLEEVDIWFKGQNWPKPALTLTGKDADVFVEALWRRSRVKRHFVKKEIKSDD